MSNHFTSNHITRDLPKETAQLFQLEQFALFDYEHALKNCGNHTIVVELLTLMLTQELPGDLQQMQQAYAKQDFTSVENIAHRIKGGAVYVGATRMKYACQYLERYWKTGSKELFDNLYQQAIQTINETSAYLSNWLSKIS